MLDPVALHQAAQDALRRTRYDEARSLCLALIGAKPSFEDGYFLLGLAEAGAGRIVQALESLDHAVRLAPRAEYLAQYAKYLVMTRQDARALSCADRAISLGPTDALTIDTIANVYSRMGVHEEAAPLFQAALTQPPEYVQMRFNFPS